MESLKTGSLLVLFLAIVSTSGSTGLHLGVSFDQLNELVYDKMHLKCSGDGKMYGPRMTLMMKLGKVGDPKPLAVFNLGTGITMRPMNASNTITAVGHVDKVSSQIFLTVTIDRPDEKDAGTYRCQLLYMDQKHQIQEEEDLLKVVIEAPDMSTLMKFLVKQLEDLKDTDIFQKEINRDLNDTVRFQKEMISELNDTVRFQKEINSELNGTVRFQKKMISELNDTVRFQKEMISELNDTTKANTKSTQSHDRVLAELNVTDIAMRDQFQDFKTKATYQCAFMVRFKDKDPISRNQRVQFKNIVMNLGGAYNPRTHVFTAPVGGLYVFMFSIRIRWRNHESFIFLRVNQEYVANVYAADVKRQDQTSTSAVVRLQAGDKVDLWVSWDNAKILCGKGYTMFSGSLLQAI